MPCASRRPPASKPKSTSHTDTSFKARTITLPNQSIVDDGKSITHYLQLLSHHSHKTRNQTLLYIKEHFIEKAASEKRMVLSVSLAAGALVVVLFW